VAKDKYEKAKEKYFNDAEKGKRYYDSTRGASDADPDEWEQNLQRSDSDDSDGGGDDD
jgi:hypothetical protein